VEIINKKAVLSQGNRVYLPIHLMTLRLLFTFTA